MRKLINQFGQRDCTLKPQQIVLFGEVPKPYAYVDTIELFFRRMPQNPGQVVNQIRMTHGHRQSRIKPVGKPGSIYGWRLTIQRPTVRTVSFLQQLAAINKFTVSRFDLALDWTFKSETRKQEFRDWLVHHLLVLHRRKGPMLDDFESSYWVYQVHRKQQNKSRSNRDLILYASKASKVTGEVQCCHLELKFYNAASVKRAGVFSATDLLTLNPRQMFSKNIKLVDFDLDKFRLDFVRKNMALLNESYKGRRGRIPELYRAMMLRRLWSFIERLTQNRLQRFKDIFGARSFRGINIGVLNIQDSIDWDY